MSKRITASVLISAIAVAASTPAEASATARPALKASPARVSIGASVTLRGSHLAPNQQFLLLLAIPKIQKGATERFFKSFAKSDSHGNLLATQQIPILNRCGAATIYAYPFPARKTSQVEARITITGCRTRKRTKIPPPPAP